MAMTHAVAKPIAKPIKSPGNNTQRNLYFTIVNNREYVHYGVTVSGSESTTLQLLTYITPLSISLVLMSTSFVSLLWTRVGWATHCVVETQLCNCLPCADFQWSSLLTVCELVTPFFHITCPSFWSSFSFYSKHHLFQQSVIKEIQLLSHNLLNYVPYV